MVFHARFITGPPNLSDDTNLGKVPRVYVNTDTTYEDCHLVVYKALSANVCLLVDGKYTSVILAQFVLGLCR